MPKTWFILYRGNRWGGRRPCRWLPRGNSFFWVLTRDHEIGMRARPRYGICRVEMWPRHVRLGSLATRAPWVWEYPSVKRVKAAEKATVKHLAALETDVFRDFLSVLEVVALLQYEDGEPRESGWLTVRVNGSAWQVVVKDPTSCCSIAATGRTVDEAFIALALLLGSESPPWEPDSYLSAQAAKKRKK